VHYFGHYPDVLAHLRQELDSNFGSDPNRPIIMEDVSKMQYTEAVIKECSRLELPIKESFPACRLYRSLHILYGRDSS